MSAAEDIRPAATGDAGANDANDTLVVDIDGWEGPLDLLLTLARAQKVDLRQLSIVQLADQYLAYVAAAGGESLARSAEYLTMAAWLADLKSGLLLPRPACAEEATSEEMAAALAFRLRRLDAMRRAAARLTARPQLGRDVWYRRVAGPGPVTEIHFTADLRDLLRARADHLRRHDGHRAYRIEVLELDSIDAALGRIRDSLGRAPGWESLIRYLPEGALDGLHRGELRARSALAATFAAALELARQGILEMRQKRPFGPIFVKPQPPAEERARDPS